MVWTPQEGAERIARSMALADAFELHLAVGEPPALLGLRDTLPQTLQARTKQAGRVVELPPPSPTGTDPSLPLMTAIMEAPQHEQGVLYYLLDAHSLAPDEDRWAEAFARLNLQRNAITRLLQKPLLLLLSIQAYALLGRYAPDLLSIRTSFVDLGASPPTHMEWTRAEHLELLQQLLPAQFELLLFYLSIPTAMLSGNQAPQATRAVELLRLLEARGDMEKLRQQLEDMGLRPRAARP